MSDYIYAIEAKEVNKIFKKKSKETIALQNFNIKIKKGSRVLIIEDVITTGKSSMECVKLIKKSKAKSIGFATIIDRSSKKSLIIKKKIVSQLKIDVPTYKKNQLPEHLKLIPITSPGSRFIK